MLVTQWKHDFLVLYSLRLLVLTVLKSPKTTSCCQILLGQHARLNQERIAAPLAEVEVLCAEQFYEIKGVFLHFE